MLINMTLQQKNKYQRVSCTNDDLEDDVIDQHEDILNSFAALKEGSADVSKSYGRNPSAWFKTGAKSLARKCRIVDDRDDGKTNLIQSLFNVINANLGTGILAMPFVLRLAGYWGLLITVVVGVLGNYTGKILINLLYEESEDNLRIRVRDSYADIGEEFNVTFGRYMVHVINCIEQFSHCILLLIMPGTVIAHTFPSSGLTESVWIFLLSLIIIPTILLRKMHQVTWTSIASVCIAVLIGFCVLVYSLTKDSPIWSDKITASFDVHVTPISIGIITVTFSSQAYLPSIERCMRQPELFEPVMDFAYVVVTVFKMIVGIVVFLVFLDKTDQIMTLNLPKNIFGDMVNNAAIVLSLSFFTVPMFAVFDIIENQVAFPEFCRKFMDEEKTVLGTTWLTSNLVFRLLIVIFVITIAAYVPHFSLLMSFVGNTTGMILVLFYPSLFYLKIRWDSLSVPVILLNISIMILALVSSGFGVHSAAKAFYSVYNEET